MEHDFEYNSSSEMISILNEDEEEECSPLPLTEHITEHLVSAGIISDDEDEEEMNGNDAMDETIYSMYSKSPQRRIEEILKTTNNFPPSSSKTSFPAEFSSENLFNYRDDEEDDDGVFGLRAPKTKTTQFRKNQPIPTKQLSYEADDSSSVESLSSLSSYHGSEENYSTSSSSKILNNPILGHPYHSQYPHVTTAPSLSLQLGINQLVANQTKTKNVVQYLKDQEQEKETNKSKVDNLKKELDRKDLDFKGLRGENDLLKKEIQKINAKVKDLTEELTTEKRNVIENKNKFTIDLEKKESEIEHLNSTVEQLRIENEKLNQQAGIEKMKHDEELSKLEFMLAELKLELVGLKEHCLEAQNQLNDELKRAIEYSNDLSNNIKIQKEELVVMKSINSEIIENLKERDHCLKSYEDMVSSKSQSLDLRDSYIEEERNRHKQELEILMERISALEQNNDSLKDVNQKLSLQIKSQDGAMKNLLSLTKKLENESEDLKLAHKQNIKELTDSFKLMLKESVLKMSVVEGTTNISPELEQANIDLRLMVKKQEEELAKTRKLLQLSKKEIEDQHNRFELYKIELDESSKKRASELFQLRNSNSQLLENYLDTERERSAIQIEFNELKLENSRKDLLLKQLEQQIEESKEGMDSMLKENSSLKNQVASIKQQYAEDHFVVPTTTPRTPPIRKECTTPTKPSRISTPTRGSVKRPGSASKQPNSSHSSSTLANSLTNSSSSYSSQHQSLRNSGSFGTAAATIIKPEVPRTNYPNYSASNTRMKEFSDESETFTVTTIIPKQSNYNRPGSAGRSSGVFSSTLSNSATTQKRPPSRPNSSNSLTRKSTTPTNSRGLTTSVGSTRPVLKNLTPSKGLFM